MTQRQMQQKSQQMRQPVKKAQRIPDMMKMQNTMSPDINLQRSR